MKSNSLLDKVIGLTPDMIHIYANSRPEFMELSNIIKAQMPLEKQRRIVRQAQIDSAVRFLNQTKKGK